MMWIVLFAGVASAAFSFIFNVKGKTLLFAGLCGAIGYFVYLLSGGGTSLSFLYAGVSIALASEIMARIFSIPATLFLVGGLLPLVPGGEMFRMFLSFTMSEQLTAIQHLGNTLVQAGALAVGAIFVKALLQLIAIFGKKRSGYRR